MNYIHFHVLFIFISLVLHLILCNLISSSPDFIRFKSLIMKVNAFLKDHELEVCLREGALVSYRLKSRVTFKNFPKTPCPMNFKFLLQTIFLAPVQIIILLSAIIKALRIVERKHDELKVEHDLEIFMTSFRKKLQNYEYCQLNRLFELSCDLGRDEMKSLELKDFLKKHQTFIL